MGHIKDNTPERGRSVTTEAATGRIDRAELLDDPATPREDALANLRDIARLNALLGGTRAALQALGPLVLAAAAAKSTPVAPIRILDVGAGSADIPRAIARRAAAGGFPGAEHRAVLIRAVDTNPAALALARKRTPRHRYPGIDIEEADALSLPYPDGAFDIAVCSQLLHQFAPGDAVRLLRELSRVTTTGFLVSDLVRSRIAAALVALLTRAAFMNRVTRHDAPVSVMRAYSLAEYRQLAEAAGLPDASVRAAAPFRVTLVYRRGAAAGRQG